jgi:hypothetical protein
MGCQGEAGSASAQGLSHAGTHERQTGPGGHLRIRTSGLLHVLMLPDFERAERIGEFWAIRRVPSAELLIDCEEDRTLRAMLVGMLREDEMR